MKDNLQWTFSCVIMCTFLLSGELLAERCRTDDLMPSIPVLCLPPSRVDPKVLGLNVLVYHSQPGGSWTTRRSPPIKWWSQRGGDDTAIWRCDKCIFIDRSIDQLID